MQVVSFQQVFAAETVKSSDGSPCCLINMGMDIIVRRLDRRVENASSNYGSNGALDTFRQCVTLHTLNLIIL